MSVLTVLAIGILFLPWLLIWGLWLLLALLARPRPAAIAPAAPLPRIDILIPAHNEQLLLPALLQSLRRQNTPEVLNTILVVADHCTDSTLQIAAAAGAAVLLRDSGPPGKPAALRAGLASLAAQPHPADAILFLDADCTCSENLLLAMASELAAGHPVLQAAYVLAPPSPSSIPFTPPSPSSLAESVQLGVFLKNVLRPRGSSRLGLPCQLFGTGMLFRRDILSSLTFQDHLIEDLRISQDLLRSGIRPRFVPEAQVTSPAPRDRPALTTQRLRWEAGQAASWRHAASLELRLLSRGDLRSALAILDWSAPPLALALLTWALTTLAVGGLSLFHLVPRTALLWPFLAIAPLAAYLLIGVLAAQGPRGLARLLLHAPGFILWKLSIYLRLARRGPTAWERTPRPAGDRP